MLSLFIWFDPVAISAETYDDEDERDENDDDDDDDDDEKLRSLRVMGSLYLGKGSWPKMVLPTARPKAKMTK